MKEGEQNRKENKKFIPHTHLQTLGRRESWRDGASEVCRRHDEEMQCGTGSFELSICFSAADNHHVCITTCLLLLFCCKFPQYLLKQKWSYNHEFYFGHVNKAYYRLNSEVDEESSHNFLQWLQHSGFNNQLAQTGMFIRPRRGYLPSPNIVFVLYKLCGHSSLRKTLRELKQNSSSSSGWAKVDLIYSSST